MENILPFSVWIIAKIGLLFALGIYFVFALVLLRQIHLMARVLSNPYNWLIKLFAWLHLLIAILVFFLAFLIL